MHPRAERIEQSAKRSPVFSASELLSLRRKRSHGRPLPRGSHGKPLGLLAEWEIGHLLERRVGIDHFANRVVIEPFRSGTRQNCHSPSLWRATTLNGASPTTPTTV